MNKELQVVIMPEGSLQLEWNATGENIDKSTDLLQGEIFKRFHSQPSWLLFLSLCDQKVPLSVSLNYWRNFTALFARKLSLTPDLEILRHTVKIPGDPEELQHTLESAPLMTGGEYLTIRVLQNAWDELNRAFGQAIETYEGSISDFIKTYSPDVHLVGRVFFHLVEQKHKADPFAFLATFSTGLDKQGQSRHWPLKWALTEYAGDNEKLLDLLSTVHKAAEQSELLTHLLDSGEIFHPLSWTAGEAFSFLKEIPIYEASGILCRIPNWWKGNTAKIRMNITLGTVQPAFVGMLAFLSVIKSLAGLPASLLVVPASLVSNWVDEIHRFFPTLNYYVAHPGMQKNNKSQTDDKDKNKEQLDGLDLVITTYAMSSRYEWIGAYTWAYIILDEAQAIKNPGTAQTLKIKKLKANNRIILTGTPIENRLSDLWSLFDFLNPGLLGSRNEFSEFSKRLNDSPDGYARLRKLVMPFILRRMKTDKSIISDLPDKVEIKTYAVLTKKQIVLYHQLVREFEQIMFKVEGIERKGLILAFLMKFKQLCNHTDQYLGGGGYEENDSGKFTRLREICETVYEKRERVLVFTQFKEITEPLSRFLAGVFNKEGLILHGSVPVSKRKDIVRQFQGDDYVPYMVLSLKAGGVGLNLTRANHVIHFDRWWNPAVENQATDRAFRIGQEKNVLVHKFLTQGTVEEKIDRMLEEKSRLSNEIIGGAGEAWITEMKNDELMELFQLTL